MHAKLLVALAASSLVSAQTHSLCNPVKGDKCADNPAFGDKPTVVDFTAGKSDVFSLAGGTTLTYDKSNGAVFTIKEDGNAPTITSKKYIFFGRVEVVLQASTGVGVVTSLVLQSDDLDEIDWEWLGGDTKQVQTNYFSKGDDSTYDRGGFSPVANPQTAFHTYTIDWTPEAVVWMINGQTVRTLTYNEAKGGATFPQTPMQIKLGTWVAGRKDAPKGTVEWAGGFTNYADGPFLGLYKSVTITDYSNGVKGATSYTYGDRSGSMKSIKINTDGKSSGGDDEDSSSSTSTSKPTSTKPTSTKSSSSHSSTATTLTKGTSNSAANATTTAGGSSSGGGATSAQTTGTQNQATTPANSGMKSAANFVAMGAALFLSYIVL